ncbi:MAG: hypothetical protein OXI63_00245 [Candidatus Poribacteria bacterium]|nr:hypothetical protein [Candidatus Poribacteria bacterium]
MKRIRTYVVLLLSINLFVSSGQVVADEVISFISREDGTSPIILMNTQGKILKKVITAPGKPGNLTWAPDGRSFAYGSRRTGSPDIHVMNIKTNTHRQLTFHGRRDIWPAWSPNGKWIAFVSDRTGWMSIYRMDVNGENVKKLTNRGDCGRPAWSPDSQWIAYGLAPDKLIYGLFVMDAEGRKTKKIAENVPHPGCTWSPDGKQIAFTAWDAEGGINIFSSDVNGRKLRQLTWSALGTIISQPVWSPSGKWIAYFLGTKPVGFGVPVDQIYAKGVIRIIDTTAKGEREKSIKATKGLLSGPSIEWVPEKFFSVSPSTEKQTTLWGRLKQAENTTK